MIRYIIRLFPLDLCSCRVNAIVNCVSTISMWLFDLRDPIGNVRRDEIKYQNFQIYIHKCIDQYHTQKHDGFDDLYPRIHVL